MRRALVARAVGVFAGVLVLASVFVVPARAQTPAPPQTLARITSPVREQTLRSSVTIQGSATAPRFARYEVSYAPEPNAQNWTVIGGGTQPVENGFLASWNTRPLNDGAYALRVQVFTSDGKVVDMPSPVRNLTIANGGAAQATPATSQTPSSAITSTTATTRTVSSGSDADAERDEGFDLAAIPRAVGRGAQLAALGFVVLGAYLVVKRLIGFAIGRLRRKPIDYGR